MMTDDKTECSSCGREIRRATAERRNGMCAPCHRNSQKPPEELFADQVFSRIDAAIEPFRDYKSALRDLGELPRGYALCFAFHYVHSDILNGGISQLYSNSTWSLVVDAEDAAQQAGLQAVSSLLREIVYYYHRQGRSKHKRRLGEDYFSEIPSGWDKSLSQLDDQYFAMEDDANEVVLKLCKNRPDLFAEA